jgi:hypothetical protein
VEEYAHTALMEMLTTTVTGPDLAGLLGPLAGRRPVLNALIEGLGPVVSTLFQVTLGLGGRAAAGVMSLGSAEEELRTSGRDLMCAVLQAVVDAASAGQERVPGGVDGLDGVHRPRVEDDHTRTVATVLGRITVSRLAYRAPGVCNVHPLDEVLDLPDGLYSTGLARLSAREGVRGSFVEAADAVEYVTGVRIGTRQLIELTRAAAADAVGYYTARQVPAADPGDALVITADGKGIPVRPEALRAGTARLAARTKHAGVGGTSGNAGGRGNCKRMAVMRISALRPLCGARDNAACVAGSLAVVGSRAQVFRIIASQLVEEGEELVGRLVAAGLGVRGCGAGQCLFFEGEMGVKVDLTRSRVLVAQPQRDGGQVTAAFEQSHGRCVAQGVWARFLRGEGRAASSSGFGMSFDQASDGVAAERGAARAGEDRVVGQAAALGEVGP